MSYPNRHNAQEPDWPQQHDGNHGGGQDQDWSCSLMPGEVDGGPGSGLEQSQLNIYEQNWVRESVNGVDHDCRPILGYINPVHIPNTSRSVTHVDGDPSQVLQCRSEVSVASGGQHRPALDTFGQQKTYYSDDPIIPLQESLGRVNHYTAPAIPSAEAGKPVGRVRIPSVEVLALNSRGLSGTNAQLASGDTPLDSLVYNIACPYDCGTILTGAHAAGNLTRHLKSHACPGSGRPKAKYICEIQGCGRGYTRSDGLKVHMRRRHDAPPAPPKNGTLSEYDDEEE